MAFVRLCLRLQRFEIGAVVVLIGLLVAAAAIVSFHLTALVPDASCFGIWFSGSQPPGTAVCGGAISEFFVVDAGQASRVMLLFSVAPVLVGLLLGAPLVAREIEAGTAPLAWSLSGSRLRWLALRLTPMLLLVVALLCIAGLASQVLLSARQPWVPNGETFLDPAGHGFVIVTRGVAAFLLSVAIGAIVGRQLPAVIVAAAILAAGFSVGEIARTRWLYDTAVRTPLTEPISPTGMPGAAIFGSASRTFDGRVISDEEALSLMPAGEDPATWMADNFEGVYLAVPGDRYRDWVLVESAVLVASWPMALAVTSAVVRRKRVL